MKLNSEQTKEILNIKDDNITKSLFIQLFGRTEKNIEPKYQPNDTFMLPAGVLKCYKEKTPLKTTIGRFIFNVFLNESILQGKLPYYNGTDYEEFDKWVIDLYIEGDMNWEQMLIYQTKRNWMAFTPVEILVPGLSFNSMMPNPIVMKRKKELFKQYEKELAAGDVNVAKKIEDELLALAREVNKDDPSIRLYDCKKPSFGNNFKNMTVMVGAIKSNDDGSYYISPNSYLEGIEPGEYGKFADQLVTGSYSRSVQTQEGGALVKEFQSAMQSETMNVDPNSDCHTKLTLPILLTNENKGSYMWKYIVEGNNLIRLSRKNINNYIGKVVHMRTAIFCKDPEYCEKCSGALFSKLNVKNGGLTSSAVGSRLMNLALKSMHDSTIKTSTFDFRKYFKDFK